MKVPSVRFLVENVDPSHCNMRNLITIDQLGPNLLVHSAQVSIQAAPIPIFSASKKKTNSSGVMLES
eukprot:12906190-Prorocentrum_lima.AAC.1